MNDELCMYVVERATSGPCVTCGPLTEGDDWDGAIEAAPWHSDDGEAGTHPFLGQPTRLCLRNSDEASRLGRNCIGAHTYEPSLPCRTCKGSGRRRYTNGNGARVDVPCPDPACVLGRIPKGQAEVKA